MSKWQKQNGATISGWGRNYKVEQGDSGDKGKICIMESKLVTGLNKRILFVMWVHPDWEAV